MKQMISTIKFHFRQAIFLFFVGSLILIYGCNKKHNEAKLVDLKCENLVNPTGIHTVNPALSWKTESKENNFKPAAYQILAASNKNLLTEKEADLWNTGKVESAESLWIEYKGETLQSRSQVFWKVRIWDEKGSVSNWSEDAFFSISLLNETDWQADYIGFPEKNELPESPMLRQKFTLSEFGDSELLYINSLGYFEVYINGKKVSDDVLTPAVSQFNKRSQLICYPVSTYLKTGENDVVIWMGRGWYSFGLPGVVNKGPLVKAQLEQQVSGKWKTLLKTDETWQGRASEYSLIGDWRANRFGGEKVEGTKIMKNRSSENLNSLQWEPVIKQEVPAHFVSAQMVEPNRIVDTIQAKSVQALTENTYLVDMGTNLTGWIHIDFPKLSTGQEIRMEYCDHLDKNGNFVDRKQFDIYVASGNGRESFTNKFNYHGFRYVRISNLPEQPKKEQIQAFLIQTNYQMNSWFECSDPEINQIHNMIHYTLRCLSLGGYLVDCPQIERLGYGGDGNASTSTAQIMFGMAPLYSNWLQAWGDCIREDGGMPHTAPNPYPAGGGPYWCGFIITAAWQTYLNYGDKRLLQKYYPTMQKWLGYVEKYSTSGLLKKWPDTDYRGWYLGDWASPKGINEKSELSVDLVNNAFVCQCYDYMSKIAEVLQITEDIQNYAQKNEGLKKQVNQHFFNQQKNTYADGNQIDITYPLLAGIVPESKIKEVEQSLFKEIQENQNGHIACGLVGIPVFTEWATQNKKVELLYSILKKKEYPGYLYMIENGATTTWEEWENPRSCIHNCFNGIGSWFYEALGGIQKEPGFEAYRQVIIEPQIPEGITWANTKKETPFGILKVNWKIENAEIHYSIEIPVGVNAIVVLSEKAKAYKLNGKNVKKETGQEYIKIENGRYKLSFEI